MIIPMLFNMPTIVHLQLIRETFDPALINKTKPNFSFSHPSYNTFIKYHHASNDNVSTQEHTIFLT